MSNFTFLIFCPKTINDIKNYLGSDNNKDIDNLKKEIKNIQNEPNEEIEFYIEKFSTPDLEKPIQQKSNNNDFLDSFLKNITNEYDTKMR